jgi:hypothetical protein
MRMACDQLLLQHCVKAGRIALSCPGFVCLLQREGNILMSYNNRPATDAIPFLSPILAPSARAVGPLLEQLATSPLRCAQLLARFLLRGFFVVNVANVVRGECESSQPAAVVSSCTALPAFVLS